MFHSSLELPCWSSPQNDIVFVAPVPLWPCQPLDTVNVSLPFQSVSASSVSPSFSCLLGPSCPCPLGVSYPCRLGYCRFGKSYYCCLGHLSHCLSGLSYYCCWLGPSYDGPSGSLYFYVLWPIYCCPSQAVLSYHCPLQSFLSDYCPLGLLMSYHSPSGLLLSVHSVSEPSQMFPMCLSVTTLSDITYQMSMQQLLGVLHFRPGADEFNIVHDPNWLHAIRIFVTYPYYTCIRKSSFDCLPSYPFFTLLHMHWNILKVSYRVIALLLQWNLMHHHDFHSLFMSALDATEWLRHCGPLCIPSLARLQSHGHDGQVSKNLNLTLAIVIHYVIHPCFLDHHFSCSSTCQWYKITHMHMLSDKQAQFTLLQLVEVIHTYFLEQRYYHIAAQNSHCMMRHVTLHLLIMWMVTLYHPFTKMMDALLQLFL